MSGIKASPAEGIQAAQRGDQFLSHLHISTDTSLAAAEARE